MTVRLLAGLLPKNARVHLKGWRKRLRVAYARRCHGFGPDTLSASLVRLGLRAGDTVMVHSSFDQFIGFSGKPSDVIRTLQDIIGPAGTLLMPTLPFTGTAVEYASLGSVFDVQRTPSKSGLLTELFRRSPGVVRSIHPTHSVAAWGARATALIADHHSARTPCGEGTPFARLFEHDGRILFLGAGIESMTFFHYVEEILEPGMPVSPFAAEEFILSSRDTTGTVLATRTRLFDPVLSKRRKLTKLEAPLRQDGALAETRVGELPLVLLRACDVMAACRRLAAQGVYCYDI